MKSPKSTIWFDFRWLNPAHETNMGWISATTFCNATGHLWSMIGSRHEIKWSIDPRFQREPVAWKQQGWRPQCEAWARPAPQTCTHQSQPVIWWGFGGWIWHQSSCPVSSKPGQVWRNWRINSFSWQFYHRMGADSSSLGFFSRIKKWISQDTFLTHTHIYTQYTPSLMRAGNFSCSPQTV